MPNTHASRQLVLSRLGTPVAQLPGESFRYCSTRLERTYNRYGEYIDGALLEDRPKEALEEFLTYLEAERSRDYAAFHYGRELLLADMYVHVEYPSSDPQPQPSNPPQPSMPPVRAKLPRWSRRVSLRDRPRRVTAEQVRARVLGRLGWPHPGLPGECMVMTGSDALSEISAYFDQLAYTRITEAVVDDAIERLAALRERDWQAFCHGRTELLCLLPLEVELPKPAAPLAQAV